MNNSAIIFIILAGLLIIAGGLCFADEVSTSSPSEEHNKSIVLRYLHEVLDGKQFSIMSELFTADIKMHRPEAEWANLSFIQMIFSIGLSPHTFETTVHDIFASEDRVFVRLSHKVKYSNNQAFFQSRLGQFDVRGKTIQIDAMAIFRFVDGKIAEEWVSRDELGILMQIGSVKLVTE